MPRSRHRDEYTGQYRDEMRWWQAPAFTSGRVAFVVVLTIVTFVELHEILR